MRRVTCLASLLEILTLLSLGLQSASAQPPDLLRSYRFIPRLSTLHQTGGLIGTDFHMPISGPYDFITGYQGSDSPLPSLNPYAQFANVEATVQHPFYMEPHNIDNFLNLSGLDGTPVHHGPHGLVVYHFSGFDSQESRVDLHVATFRRWMFMRGGTEPLCCDFFGYDIKAIARQIPYGDFDDDGNVGASDLAAWQSGHDAAGNVLGGRDFLSWQRSYGETAPSIGEFDAMLDAALVASGNAAISAIPEPASLILIAGFAMALVNARRR
ncbi:hypothetical protein [Bythopirellula goksoeyrii]|uniref:PEP-CTERM protein-sorting domain-containing protein n=1 Tax=Bythopirellula goksoeyrii TaxID=1400387 RepID=A0A5B9QFI3_9BACT|nr:hypothetical protein [Bythopirellula goksoeyrii]QEG37817.1 hypothetical protein Pr1d_51640 [Bythopirellula goksoeyrii]